jgi:DNA topoisomerase VI subunit B
MTKELEIKVQQDHIESLTRSNGINAIAELIWNSLDADATEIRVNYSKNVIGKYEYISVEDNGNGLSYQLAEDVFQKLGGSEKKINQKSPGGRSYHGKEGKGRYKALALGDLVRFDSYYNINKTSSNHFTITISRDSLKNPKIGDIQLINKPIQGFKVTIDNINDKIANEIFLKDNFKELEEKFASYYLSYPCFQIFANNIKIDFDNLIKHEQSETIKILINNLY